MSVFPKITKAKRAGGVAQAVECLPSKYKVEFKPQYCKTVLKKGRGIKMIIEGVDMIKEYYMNVWKKLSKTHHTVQLMCYNDIYLCIY
jgi:hypothetical protein